MAGFSRGDELPVRVVRSAPGSLPSQIAEQVRALISDGFLVAGDLLPSSRSLAERLNVSRGTVVFAYEQLVGEGYLVTARGGTRVAEGLTFGATISPARRSPDGPVLPRSPRQPEPILPPQAGPHRDVAQTHKGLIDLRPGAPDTSLVASATWRAAWREAAATPGPAYPPAGSLALRVQLADHLRLMRSVLRSPDDLIVTAGARDGFRLILTALRQRVRSRPLRVAVEEPGYPSLHRIPLAFGHELVPVPVDEQGLNPAYLPTGAARPDLVLVAPSHQYPLGASMSAARRLELLAWAREHDSLIVEDDYDSELRYTGDPLPALASLDRVGGRGAEGGDRVLTLGSFSKTVTGGLNLGFVVAPQHLRDDLLDLRADLGNPVSSLVQDAMTSYLAVGGLRRHTSRMRRIYRGRRERVVDALTGLPGVQALPMDGGLHAVVHLPALPPAGEDTLVARAEEAGVLVAPLGAYWSASSGPGAVRVGTEPAHPQPLTGLVLGFGGVPDRKLDEGLGILRSILQGV
ncbi:PLP-dependent aminotransferase family protein [Rothia nasimurium]|uniref:MocR-like pyridoxine biosynthesis transcription factor PdxR n=1 Tax=Rothia nasimurium TaxID=85336 RepID=UPI003BA13280